MALSLVNGIFLPHRSVSLRQETLQAHSDRLLAMDRYAFIDVAFIQHVAGEGGQDRLATVYLQQCLPSKDKLLSIAQAIKESNAVMSGDLYKFCTSGAQGSLTAAHSVLCQVEQGLPASVTSDQTPFLQQVQSRLQYFIIFCGEAKVKFDEEGIFQKPENGTSIEYGVDALMSMWQRVKDQDEATVSFKDLEVFVTFGSFLSEEVRSEAHLMVEKKLQATSEQATKKALAHDVPVESKKKRKGAATADGAAKAAKSLFE